MLYDEGAYNAIRHAGTTYALFQVYGAIADGEVLSAAEKAAGFIRAASLDAGRGRGKAFVYQDVMKLGGQALSLVALLERRRVMRDTSLDPLINDLATFMLAMEVTKEPGRYHQSYDPIIPPAAPDSRFRLLPRRVSSRPDPPGRPVSRQSVSRGGQARRRLSRSTSATVTSSSTAGYRGKTTGWRWPSASSTASIKPRLCHSSLPPGREYGA